MKTPFDQNASESNGMERQGNTDPLTFIRAQSKQSRPLDGPSESSPLTLPESDPPPSNLPVTRRRHVTTQVILKAIALTSLPVLAIGIASSLWLHRQIQPLKTQATPESVARLAAVERQLPLLFGFGALLSGAIAAYIARREIRPIVNAAEQSNQLLNRIERGDIDLHDRVSGQNEIVALTHNLQVIDAQLPTLLSHQEGEVERFRTLMGITQTIRAALSEEDMFRAAVEEIRTVYRADRVAIYRLDSDISGTIIEESVGAGFPKMLRSTLEDPCLADYLESYQQGRIRAIHDIYNAGLDDCHIGLLARFGIKANLVAPILKDKKLFGMIIVNQCAQPRVWLSHEIELLSQVTGQLGFALDFVRLLQQTTQQMEHNQLLINILRKVRSSLNEDHVLQTIVTEWRKALRVERVMVYGFDDKWYGTVLAEDVVPGVPKAIHAEIFDPCFAEGYVAQYREGRVQAIDDIFQAGLTECHLQQLEPYQVKANLVAPILNDNQLFGLLIAHACYEPREWQAWEIDLHRQLGMQVGYALEHARVLQRLDTDMNQMQQLITLSKLISQSLDESEILNVVVEEVRKVLQTDRVMVYRFDQNWTGTVVAESVVPGYAKALWSEIHDPCFVQGFIQQYQEGRVQAVDNIYEAGLTPCHLQQLEPFQVKANLVAPILKDQTLFGLLIAHECETPRLWQPQDITLMRQISLQVGVALEHAQLLTQVEQAYQASQLASQSQQALNQSFQQEVERWVKEGQAMSFALESSALQQLDLVAQVYQDLNVNADASQTSQELLSTLNASQHQMAELMEDMTLRTQDLSSLLEGVFHTHRNFAEMTRSQDDLGQQSAESFEVFKDITSQLKLQAMNVALESARLGPSGKAFAEIGESVLTLTRQLDRALLNMQPWMTQWQSTEGSLRTEVIDSSQQLEQGVQQMQQLQDQCHRLLETYPPLQQSTDALAGVVTQQMESMTDVTDNFIAMADSVRQTSEQALALAKLVSQWETTSSAASEV